MKKSMIRKSKNMLLISLIGIALVWIKIEEFTIYSWILTFEEMFAILSTIGLLLINLPGVNYSKWLHLEKMSFDSFSNTMSQYLGATLITLLSVLVLSALDYTNETFISWYITAMVFMLGISFWLPIFVKSHYTINPQELDEKNLLLTDLEAYLKGYFLLIIRKQSDNNYFKTMNHMDLLEILFVKDSETSSKKYEELTKFTNLAIEAGYLIHPHGTIYRKDYRVTSKFISLFDEPKAVA